MTGRARGRARGRGRPREEEEVPRPGNRADQSSGTQGVQPDVGDVIYERIHSRAAYRGDMRGLNTSQQDGQSARDDTVLLYSRQQAVQGGSELLGAAGYKPPVDSMARLNVSDNVGGRAGSYQSQNCLPNGRNRPEGSDTTHGVGDGFNLGSGRDVSSYSGRGRGAADSSYRGRGRGRLSGTGHNANAQGYNAHDNRPEAGPAPSNGYPLPVTANYFRLEQTPDWILYQYNVDFQPEVCSKRMRRALLANHAQLLGATRAFDSEHILFLPIKLQNKETVVYSTRETDGMAIRITIKLTNELPPTSRQCIQIYNNIFKRLLKMADLVQIGRNYYNEKNGKEYPEHRLKVLPGYLTSILQHEAGRVFLNIDVSHKIIRTETVLEFMYSLQDRIQRENERNPDRQQDFFHLCEQRIMGSSVITLYNNKTYRVDRIDWHRHPTDTFTLRDGSSVTYIEYYHRQYDIQVEDELQPLLLAESTDRDRRRERREQQLGKPGGQAAEGQGLYLLPELCRIIGFSDSYQGDERARRDVANMTRVDPTNRHQTLSQFINQLNRNQDVQKELGGWNLQIAENPVDIQARVLPPQNIYMGKGVKFTYQPEEAYWYRKIVQNPLINAVELKNWLVIYDRRGEQNNVVPNFLREFATVGPAMGIVVRQPQIVVVNRGTNDAYIQAIRENLLSTTQLVLTIVPSFAKDRYDAIKRYTCIDHPVPSQVVVLNTINNVRRVKTVASNVAIQINCKLGGEAWTVGHPMTNLMVVGMDVYHDTVRRNQSVVGFVATMNTTFTRFFSEALFQSRGQEVIDGLQITFIAALKHYHEVNGRLPETVVVYRDGVGDGQLDVVRQYEVEQMQAAFKTIREDYTPALCVFVVQKRISTRFFCRTGRNQANPPPGTIVDNTVTRPDWVDFYIVSQSVRQGTVSPTHYIVVHDTLNLSPENLQKLTYKLCHVYFNWPGTIRVPAPCQYAHKLAYLTGQSLHKAPARDLADRLFFL